MPEQDVKGQAQGAAGVRLYLNQRLTRLRAQVEDQVAQVEQGVNQLLPDLASSIRSAQDNEQIAIMLRELQRGLPDIVSGQLRAVLAEAYQLSWRQERVLAQSKQQALERCVLSLMQAIQAEADLVRQAQLTEGLAQAEKMLKGREQHTGGFRYS
ncbi:MAG: hypothetical protein GX062_05485 [Firmicutes bacterium]|nr:hypothetical protein [Bacillota bacterium]